jgi:hypothetical protein
LRAGSCEARAVRQFKSARPGQFPFQLQPFLLLLECRLPTPRSTPKDARKRSGCARIEAMRGGSCKARAVRQFKSARPDHSSVTAAVWATSCPS